ncbi:MAG: hypothetical protein HFJ08_13650 [Lachnospiraceae bacterium]|jgi:Predicted DNA-binding protein containing a Zn-ribbon domain|nr:hypothetical protein [Lachnospiraceae bacterium]MCI9400711.1 hypothetical protein [Lachnospiraceae bacterium]
MDDLDKALEKLLAKSRPPLCGMCGGKLVQAGSGIFKCERCGNEALDDYGKVRKYLDEHGPSPAIAIAQATGVDRNLISRFLRGGKLEIPDGSKYYLRCEKCSCSIKSGRYCEDCAKELSGNTHKVSYVDIGDRPKLNGKGKMRYTQDK